MIVFFQIITNVVDVSLSCLGPVSVFHCLNV